MSKFKEFLDMVDFSHTLFGLPFAYMGAILAVEGHKLPTWPQLWWITVAMVSARTAALCLNRLIDRKVDKANPRTSNWVIPAGRLPVRMVWIACLAMFAVLFYAASQLNFLCLKLAPLAVIVLWLYSYTKRFTWWCHFILGLAIGMGTLGAWMAVSGSFDGQPLVLTLAVACWIAGFDTMYACQDIEFDRQNHLYSIPARFGEKGALVFSGVFHALTVLLLIMSGIILHLGIWYYAGISFAVGVLVYEHIIVKPGDLSRVNFASFKINRYVGLIILIATLLDIFTSGAGS